MKNVEIELKVIVKDFEEILNFLLKEAIFIGRKDQVDDYYSPKNNSFISIDPISEWLRIRKSNDKYYITYKNYHYNLDKKSDYCDELETEILNPIIISKILEVLNFKSIISVKKYRSIWTYKNYEISLDVVKNLGNFIEIEYKGRIENSPKTIIAEMVKFLKNAINKKTIERIYLGYPYLLLDRQKNNNTFI